jgi:hypothetical protein
VDGALVGSSSLWPLCLSPEHKPSGENQVAYLQEVTLVKILLQNIEFSFLSPD